jgi:hypothetical protein
MKRSPMPPRKNSINRSSLRSSTPPAEGKGKVQPARRKTGKHVGESAGRKALEKRVGDDGLCEVRLFGVCFGRGGNAHHRQNRSQQGKWDVRNLLWVCGSGSTGCHGALTNTNGRRAEFEKEGWIVPSHEDPAKKDCLIYTRWFGHDYVLLLDEYPWVELAEFPEGRPEHPDDLDLPGESRDLGGVA